MVFSNHPFAFAIRIFGNRDWFHLAEASFQSNNRVFPTSAWSSIIEDQTEKLVSESLNPNDKAHALEYHLKLH